ncbi:MAG: alpha/beta hydrolase [Rhodobacteraceae bacterium]|nr:alpha/beta hydrolase [Paracoccaceae bacterium]
MIEEKPSPFGAPSPETIAFNTALEALLADLPPPEEIDIGAARRLRAEGKGILPVEGPLPEGRWEEFGAAPVGAPGEFSGGNGRVRVIEAAEPSGYYLHIHGGGWTYGAPEHFDGRNLRLSRASGVTVVSAQYRLAPEARWPAGAIDCLAAALWTLDQAKAKGVPAMIGGESAGAHLTMVTLLRLREMGRLSEVAGAVLAYGAFDLRGTPSVRNWGARNMILSTPIVDWFAGNLLGEGGDPSSPAVSPLLADLDGMPPALLFIGDQDPLLDDTLFMAQRWRAAGSEATLQLWPGAVHAFDYFDDPKFKLPIALECQQAQAAYVQERMAAARS